MVEWRVMSTDLVTGEVGPDVPLTSGRWTTTVGRPGDFQGRLPLRRCPPALLEGGTTVLHLIVGGLFVADAIIWDPRPSRAGDEAVVQLKGASLSSYWYRRKYRTDVDFDDVDEATIVAALVDLTEDSGHGIGIDTSQVTLTGRTRDRIDEWRAEDRPWIGDLIQSLQEVEDGCMVDVLVQRPDPDLPPTRTLRVRPADGGASIVGPLRLGEAIDGYDLQILGSQAANDVETIGTGEGADMIIGRAVDATALTGWPQLDAHDPRKSVSQQATATAHARAVLAARSRPPVALRVDLDPDQRPKPSAWSPGDTLNVQLTDPPLHVSMPMWAVERTWALDDGRLRVSATLNPTTADRPNLTSSTTPTAPELRDVGGVLTAAPE